MKWARLMKNSVIYQNYSVRLHYKVYEREVYSNGKLDDKYLKYHEETYYNILDYCCINAIEKAKENVKKIFYSNYYVDIYKIECWPQNIFETWSRDLLEDNKGE